MNNIKKNFFFSYIDGGKNNSPTFKFSKKTKFISWTLILIIIIGSFVIVGFDLAPNGLKLFGDKFISFFQFKNSLKEFGSQSLISLSFEYLWISIKSVLIGTTLGFSLAFLTSFMANEKVFKIKYLFLINKIIIAFLRAFPVILFILFFKNSFSKNIAFVLIIFWFTWLWSHKYMIQIYENTNYNFYNSLLLNGFSIINSYKIAIIPEIKNKFISLFLYSFESNIRWNSLLGALGLIGIGELINLAYDYQYESMGIPILTIILFVLFLELCNWLIENFLLKNKSVKMNQNNLLDEIKLKFKIKFIIKIVFLILLVTFIIFCFASFDWKNNTKIDTYFLKSFFIPEWGILLERGNIAIDIIKLISQTFVIMFIALSISYLFLFFSTKNIFGYYSLVTKFISSIIRSLPIIFLIYLLGPIYSSPTSSICLVLGIYSASIINKQMSNHIKKIDDRQIQYYRMIGYTKFMIFNKFILLKTRFYYLDIFLFEWESKYRDLISYGSYGVSVIGAYIDEFQKKSYEYPKMASYLWVSLFITLIIITINFFIFNFYNNKNKYLSFFIRT